MFHVKRWFVVALLVLAACAGAVTGVIPIE